ncbi:hypothetical protein KKE60_04705 [Patescibacteria group bacterium]|nr:hypothetical protein [Patescibacteria group bacterium]
MSDQLGSEPAKGYFDEKDPDPWTIPILDRSGKPLRPTRHSSARDKYDKNKRHFYSITKMVWWHPSDDPEYIYMLQEMDYKEQIQFRLCYYTLSYKGLWHWGQFAPILSKREYEALHAYAIEKGLFTL